MSNPAMDSIDSMTFSNNFKKRPYVCENEDLTLENLQSFMKNGSWQDIVNRTGQILSDRSKLLHEAYCLILSMRFESLFRLKMYDDLNVEIGAALDILTTNGDTQTHLISFVFSVKLLQCETKMMTGHSHEAMEQLLVVRNWLKSHSQLSRDDLKYLEWQSSCQLVNCTIRSRNWKNSIRMLRQMLLELPVGFEPDNLPMVLSKVVLLLRLAKLFLQIGATSVAKCHHKESTVLVDQLSKLRVGEKEFAHEIQFVNHLCLLTKGLLLFGDEQFVEARSTFEELITSCCAVRADNIEYGKKSIFYVFHQSKDECILCTAVNNYSICCLHMKQNLTAIEKIEKLITEDPVKLMTDAVVFNLCTMYDLSFSPEVSTNKKKILQKVAAKFNINDPVLHWRSFRLS